MLMVAIYYVVSTDVVPGVRTMFEKLIHQLPIYWYTYLIYDNYTMSQYHRVDEIKKKNLKKLKFHLLCVKSIPQNRTNTQYVVGGHYFLD